MVKTLAVTTNKLGMAQIVTTLDNLVSQLELGHVTGTFTDLNISPDIAGQLLLKLKEAALLPHIRDLSVKALPRNAAGHFTRIIDTIEFREPR